MIQNVANIFRIEELRRRILITIGLLAIYRLGFHVPLPGISMEALAARSSGGVGGSDLLGLINVISGGGMMSLAVFSLGIMPYISSSIIFSLLAKVVPALERLSKEGSSGQRKINQYTRYSTVPICLVQAIFIVNGILKPLVGDVIDPATFNSGWFAPMVMLTLTAGTIFLMWVGEQITEHGVGNGISLLIMAGIVARVPVGIIQMFDTMKTDRAEIFRFFLMIILFLAIVIVVVYITKGQRRIPVQYAKLTRGRKVYGGQRHYFPLKVNQASVMPVIFASSLLAFPSWIASATGLTGLENALRYGAFLYSAIYIALIYFFSFFWTALMFNPAEMSKNMKEHGAFVPGIRPGRRTADYLEKIMVRITLAGATFLAVIALIPQSLQIWLGMNPSLAAFLGGTSILITVSVALDLVDKLNSHLLMRNYEGFMKGGGRKRG
jgi:preprotein translocase subunit SecY